ncbi:hypothetical protein Hanom_Chr00s000003g01605131 [Helianthus anomalus]
MEVEVMAAVVMGSGDNGCEGGGEGPKSALFSDLRPSYLSETLTRYRRRHPSTTTPL